MNTHSKKEIGKYGENVSESYYLRKGYTTIDKNVKRRYAEIDLIMSNSLYIRFIEVKTRIFSFNYKKYYTFTFNQPHLSVTRSKRKKIKRLADELISTCGNYKVDDTHSDFFVKECVIDVVSVSIYKDITTIKVFPNI